MREAASQMQSAAATISEAVLMLRRQMDDFAIELRGILEEDRKAREVSRG